MTTKMISMMCREMMEATQLTSWFFLLFFFWGGGSLPCFAFFSINSEGQKGQINACISRDSWESGGNLWVLKCVCVCVCVCLLLCSPSFSSSCSACVSVSSSFFPLPPPIRATLAISDFVVCLSLFVIICCHPFFFGSKMVSSFVLFWLVVSCFLSSP